MLSLVGGKPFLPASTVTLQSLQEASVPLGSVLAAAWSPPCLTSQCSTCWEPGLVLWGLPALVGCQHMLGSPHWPPSAVCELWGAGFPRSGSQSAAASLKKKQVSVSLGTCRLCVHTDLGLLGFARCRRCDLGPVTGPLCVLSRVTGGHGVALRSLELA